MHMLDLLALFNLITIPVATAFGVAWWNARKELHLRAELGHPAPARSHLGDGRVEQAIDAIAIEVERIAEGQRFVTRLLAERAPAERPLLGRGPND